MKILHIITGLSTGGAERALFNVLRGLGNRVDQTVVSLLDEGAYGARIRELGIPIQTLGMRRGIPGPGTIVRLRKLVRQIDPDIVQGWMYHGNMAGSLSGWLAPGRPAVAWNIRQCLYGLQYEKPTTRFVIRRSRPLSSRVDAIIYNSILSRRQHEEFGFVGDRAWVIPNGIDLNKFRPADAGASDIRSELDIPADVQVIAHVARFHSMKDHVGFLNAAVRVARQISNLHVILAGRDVGDDQQALRGAVPDAMRARFHFLGERTDVPALMQAANVFCQSSWAEAFPNVLGEAMACQLPCVATDVGDSAAILADTGILVGPRDADALANGLLEMLSKPDSERLSLGRAARARVATHYTLPRIVEQYAAFYANLAVAGGTDGQT